MRHDERYMRAGISSQSYHHLLATRGQPTDHLLGLKSPPPRDGSDERKGGGLHHLAHHHHHHLSALTPSDTSIDDSVKSGQVGQGDLLRYLNRSRPPALSATGRLSHHSDSEHGGGGGATSPTVEALFSPPPPPPPLCLLPTSSTGSGSHYRRGINEPLSREYYPLSNPHRAGFAPYFPPSPSSAAAAHHQMVSASSPRYSSPPPPLIPPSSSSRDSILGSPRGAYEDLGSHSSRLYPPLDPPVHHHAPASISPTAGLYHHHHSPSPSLEMFGQHAPSQRLLPAHPASSPYHTHHAAYPSGFSAHHHGGSGSMLLPSSHQQLGYYKLPDEASFYWVYF